MCLTEQEVAYDSIIRSVCEKRTWGCFCGYHDDRCDVEPTIQELAEIGRLLKEQEVQVKAKEELGDMGYMDPDAWTREDRELTIMGYRDEYGGL